jgi:hypothetical protein
MAFAQRSVQHSSAGDTARTGDGELAGRLDIIREYPA